MTTFVRIKVLKWADILAAYTMFAMQTYLTDVWKLSFTHANGILNIWNGVTKVLPIGFLYLVDTFLGHFLMLLLSSLAYSVIREERYKYVQVLWLDACFSSLGIGTLTEIVSSMGMGFLYMSTPPVLASSMGTCKDYEPNCICGTQKVLFYTALALLAVGIAGHSVSLYPFFVKQRTNFDIDDGNKIYFQILGMVMVTTVPPIIGSIVLPHIKQWTIQIGIPAICTAAATLLFLSGSCSYIKPEPQGSPLTNVCRVFVASTFKISQQFPLDDKELYRKDGPEHQSFSHTRVLRFSLVCFLYIRRIWGLEKAAIILRDRSLEEQEKNRWRLCTVAEVEEAKIVVRMVPMWMTFIVCGIVSSMGNTYFLEQANHLDRKLGKWTLPLPVFLLLFNGAKTLFSISYSRLARCFAGYKKYAPSVGIAVAMVLSVLCCITSAKIEIRRLKVIRRHDLLDKSEDDIPMSIFWLLYQFFLLAGLDTFFKKSSIAFFKDQAPKSMINYLRHWSEAVSGLGFIGGVLSVYVVGNISEKGGRQNWFQYTLNKSRLDRYYWVLAALSSVNMLVFILIAYIYRYKELEPEPEPEPEPERNSELPKILIEERLSKWPEALVAVVVRLFLKL
ncbi:protein NRT1/ PTR FAMILY 5.5-like [Olea europaea var. sylvestris]|uniref:protein NRT1/ PTR FAMILY 5.5-like n=1 Tax=Olea europaea var. sylvestris TaxID=158386 RepID=UPI000C1D54D5|nr:protein NRT1/ PTR FAMILY 5.5-like [Olea europaea var. sylvestris]